jgi:hypothetical protein
MKSSPLSAAWPGREPQSLVWLASFPRSGNTFTRILLANYFAAEQEAYDINRLQDFIPADTGAGLWGSFAAGQNAAPTLDWSWNARHRFFDYYRALPKPHAFAGLKTHTANVQTLGLDAFQFRKSDRIIYIVRHPLDVVLSYADYNGRDLESAVRVMSTSGTCVQYPYPGGVEVRGSWIEHVTSWLHEKGCPVLLVRYEELCANTEQILKAMLDFLHAPILPERIRRAVDASRFDRVRAQEEQHRFIETPDTVASGTFFRRGQSLQWLRELSPDQAYRLADACEPVMSKLGYTHARDVYFDGRNALQPINLQA